jgi:hypothetical protein
MLRCWFECRVGGTRTKARTNAAGDADKGNFNYNGKSGRR